MTSGLQEFLLAFADDEHLMGQQHTEWIGVAPFLEEDLAFSSIGQDELGHASLLYEIVLRLDGVEPTDEAVDSLAYGRVADDYRSCHLVERTTSDWADALVRHWIYDTFEAMRWQLVAESSLPQLRALAERALREERFHVMHADALLDQLLLSPPARIRVLSSLDSLVALLPGLCEPPAGEAAAISQHVSAASTVSLLEPLRQATATRFDIDVSSARFEAGGGAHDKPISDAFDGAAGGSQDRSCRRTVRSPCFGPLMRRMREVLDYDPAARW